MGRMIALFLAIFDFYYRLKGHFVKKNSIMFIPHSGMCSVDHYDIINYKSDSALSFLHYILGNNLQKSKKIIVAISDNVVTNFYDDYVKINYPDYDISFITLFLTKKYGILEKLRIRKNYNNSVISSSHIFTSITYDLSSLIEKNQVLCDLNYYSTALKNDIFEPGDPHYMDYRNVGKEYTYIFLPSEISIRLSLAEYRSVSYRKFKYLGLCRIDNLLNGDRCTWLREEITKNLSYPLKTLVLYMPTHRDYEANNGSNKRSVLGFEYNDVSFEKFMKENGIVIYCKLHPKQNAQVVNSKLPEGIILHTPSERYGLNELMQVSDALMTDYTSGYFDYILLNKPIIFNLYDLDFYKKDRGIPFEPIESVIAGDIVKNEQQLKEALTSLDDNYKNNELKRKFIKEMFFTYPDGNSCERIYNFIFNN